MDWVAITCGSAVFYAAGRWLHGRLQARKSSAGLCKGDRRGIPLKAVVANCEAKWFLQELQQAMSGDHAAMVRVSHMLLVGYGTRQDEAAAATWMRKAWALQNFKEPADPYLQYEMLDFGNSDIPVLNDPLQQPAAAAASHTTASAAVASLQRHRQRRNRSSTQADEATTTAAAAAAAAEPGGAPQSSPQSAPLDGGCSSSSSSGSSGVQAGSHASAAGAVHSSSTSSLSGSRGSRQAPLHTLTPAAAPAALNNQQEQQQGLHQQQVQQQPPPHPDQLAANTAQQQVGCGSNTQRYNDSIEAAALQHCAAVNITTAQSSRQQQQQQEHQLLLPPTLQWQVQQLQLQSQVAVASTSGQEDVHCRMEHCYPQAC